MRGVGSILEEFYIQGSSADGLHCTMISDERHATGKRCVNADTVYCCIAPNIKSLGQENWKLLRHEGI